MHIQNPLVAASDHWNWHVVFIKKEKKKKKKIWHVVNYNFVGRPLFYFIFLAPISFFFS
jgi:hypothetical protein